MQENEKREEMSLETPEREWANWIENNQRNKQQDNKNVKKKGTSKIDLNSEVIPGGLNKKDIGKTKQLGLRLSL